MNDSLLKADIFFFVATLSLVALTLMLIVGMFYIMSILRTIKKISRSAQVGTDTIVESIKDAKTEFARDGFVPETIFSIFKRLYQKGNKRKK